MLIYSAPGPAASGVTANMVVTKDKMPPNLPATLPDRMHALLNHQAGEMRDRLARFEEDWRNVDQTLPLAEIKVQWAAPQGPVAQWVTFLEQEDGALLVATATCGRGEFDDHEPIFRRMLESMKTAA